jgi:hypothetical protein
MPWLFRIAANSERRVATSLIAPSRYKRTSWRRWFPVEIEDL